MVIGQAGHPQIHVVLVFHSILKHVKLQCAHHAYDDLLQARAGDLEDLDGALLCDLLRSLDELLSFHGVLRRDPHKVLRLKRGDA